MISKFNDLLNYLFDSYKKSSIDNILHIDTTTFTKPLEIKINYHTSRYISNSMEIEEFYRHYNKSMLKKDIEYCIRLISYKKIYSKLHLHFPEASEAILKDIEQEIENHG